MIRLFLLAAGFVSVTIALVMSQMGDPDASDGTPVSAISSEATRADRSLFDAPRAFQAEPVMETTSVSPTTVIPDPVLTGDSANQIDMMTRSILNELRRPVTGDRLRQAASNTGGRGDGMRDLTDNVLAGLGTPSPDATGRDAGNPQSLNALIIQAMREGQSDAYVDSLINEAVGRGQVAAPAAIVTSSGEVDTATLLDSLVQKSTAAAQAPTQTEIPQPAPEGDLTYVVQPGDSLAGIALRHYGTTTAHDIIFMANRDKLPSPSAIRPGMNLRIPAL